MGNLLRLLTRDENLKYDLFVDFESEFLITIKLFNLKVKIVNAKLTFAYLSFVNLQLTHDLVFVFVTQFRCSTHCI